VHQGVTGFLGGQRRQGSGSLPAMLATRPAIFNRLI
jgi:hypothetical protein